MVNYAAKAARKNYTGNGLWAKPRRFYRAEPGEHPVYQGVNPGKCQLSDLLARYLPKYEGPGSHEYPPPALARPDTFLNYAELDKLKKRPSGKYPIFLISRD